MIRLDGKEVSRHRRLRLKEQIREYQVQFHSPPHLVVVLVGENPASQVYVRNKIKACEEVGIRSTQKTLPASISKHDLLTTLHDLNQDPSVDGILVQLPLPKPLTEDLINENIEAEKDVDGFSYRSLGYFFGGHPQGLVPCTPKGILSILEHYKIPLVGKHAVVVGRSMIVGKPMAYLLTQANATVTLCHSKTTELSQFTRMADLVVVAAGKPRFLGREDFKQGSVVVDVGIHNYVPEKMGFGGSSSLCGDVRFEELEDWAFAATPVPGGVGPMTITSLLENTLFLAQVKRGLKKIQK